MKRYMLFGFDTYYPSGGMNDFRFSFDTKEEFQDTFYDNDDNYHIFDTRDTVVTNRYMKAYEIRAWVENNV
jgi:hypothetical protein